MRLKLQARLQIWLRRRTLNLNDKGCQQGKTMQARKTIITMLALLSVAAPAAAQHIYKCSDGSYQQTPCPTGTKPTAVIRYTPEPSRPAARSENFSFGDAGGQRYVQPQYNQPQYQQPRSTGGLIANPHAPSLQDRLRTIASDPAYKGSPSARRAAMNAAMQEAGIPSAGEYQAPRAPSPTDDIGRPVRVIDQGTSMPVDGAIKVAPNMIWDPSTGRYRQTY